MLLNCVVGEDSWESLESPKIKPVSPKENYSWIFIGRTDAEVPILWPPDAKNWLLRKDSDAGKDWRQEEMVTTEDEMVGWHHGLNGHEFWASSGSWWWTGKLSMLQSMGSQRVGHDWVTELNWLKLSPKVWKEVKDFYSHHPRQHHIGAKSQCTKVRKTKDIQIEKGETKLSNCRRQDYVEKPKESTEKLVEVVRLAKS